MRAELALWPMAAESPVQQTIRAHQNENPFGCSPLARKAYLSALSQCELYPDPQCQLIRSKIAARWGLSTDQVFVGNGVDEIILLSALCFAGAGQGIVTTESTFPGFANSARAVRAKLSVTGLSHAYSVPLEKLAKNAAASNASLLFICNPHNPAGTVISRAEIEAFFVNHWRSSFVPVFDEAYAEFADEPFCSAIPFIARGAKALALRTFSKAYGLAGARIGYAVGPAERIAQLWKLRGAMPFAVNRAAQAAAAAAFEDAGFLETTRRRTLKNRQLLCEALDSMEISYVPSQTNFLLLKTSISSSRAAEELQSRHGVLARDASAFGLPNHLRITVVDEPDIAKLCLALRDVLCVSA